jgi:hypothetical protein
MPDSLFETLRLLAKKENLSIDQYALVTLFEKASQIKTEEEKLEILKMEETEPCQE